MALPRRSMRLNETHLAVLKAEIADPGPQLIEGFRTANDDDFASEVERIRATMPLDGFWLFGCGSLIWKPETAFIEKRIANARGWHRRFCLGWDYRYRGSRETPGLMMALDRGGQCKGMVYRLPDETLEDELQRLVRREISMVPSAFPWRWINVTTEAGPLRALTFAMDRKSPRYIAGLSDSELAAVLATARGFRGSMAEYLFLTVSHLEELGIHDRNLWRLQDLVARDIERRFGLEQ